MKKFFVYAIVSEKDSIIYVGIALNCEARLKEHNSGKSRYTRAHTPWSLFYSEYVGDTILARVREKYYKSASGKRRLRAILNAEK